MTKAKNQLSPREQYRRIRQAEEKTETLHDFTAPSGMVFKLRRPDMSIFAISGRLPLDLAEKMASIAEKNDIDPGQAFTRLDVKDQIRGIQFSAGLVKHVCVCPRVVDDPQSDDEISPEELLRKDFDAILAWANGGGAAEGLNTFRGKQKRRDAAPGSDGEGPRSAGEQTIGNNE